MKKIIVCTVLLLAGCSPEQQNHTETAGQAMPFFSPAENILPVFLEDTLGDTLTFLHGDKIRQTESYEAASVQLFLSDTTALLPENLASEVSSPDLEDIIFPSQRVSFVAEEMGELVMRNVSLENLSTMSAFSPVIEPETVTIEPLTEEDLIRFFSPPEGQKLFLGIIGEEYYQSGSRSSLLSEVTRLRGERRLHLSPREYAASTFDSPPLVTEIERDWENPTFFVIDRQSRIHWSTDQEEVLEWLIDAGVNDGFWERPLSSS
ncbi:hypothetical protein [Alkalicoccus urumqiensis]|uniref:Uncharacterized protein n=1 Tax=Alkalicoccus urumqiensis TaxID=1548213 RepID=A0A2P6MGT4_ALKUR|nr:hypothetical protein [Alkalicoccus urumqiensis]PRO65491.1 hypothetical protein C6I21_10080 [Alkalicoccus urumqiensis]